MLPPATARQVDLRDAVKIGISVRLPLYRSHIFIFSYSKRIESNSNHSSRVFDVNKGVLLTHADIRHGPICNRGLNAGFATAMGHSLTLRCHPFLIAVKIEPVGSSSCYCWSVIENNFATVAVSEILQMGLCPDTTRPAPYLLVVDDEPLIADTLGLIFRNQGYAVATSYDAESAIEIAELAPPQVVITDFVLPGMNGVELAFFLRDLIPDCRIVLISGNPEEASR